MFPIRDESLRSRIIADLAVYLADNVQAWELLADGRYERLAPKPGSEAKAAQITLLRQLAEMS